MAPLCRHGTEVEVTDTTVSIVTALGTVSQTSFIINGVDVSETGVKTDRIPAINRLNYQQRHNFLSFCHFRGSMSHLPQGKAFFFEVCF